jgi:hypothetical protein
MRLRPASAPRDSAPPAARPGRLSAGVSASFNTLRQRWFLLFGRDALLFLALTLAVVSLDTPQASWMLWWPMPLALAACTMTFMLHGASPVRWRHMVNLGLFALPLAARVWLASESPIRHAAVIEARELGVILLLGVAIWFIASCHPGRALVTLTWT